MTTILIVDDDIQVRDLLVEILKPSGYRLMVAETLKEGLDIVATGLIDLVFLDVYLPDGNGLDALPEIKYSVSLPEVIIITGEGDTSGAKMALESEAWDYVLKPFSKHEIELNIKQALEFRASRKALQSPAESVFYRPDIIGSSPKLTSCLNLAAQCAKKKANVLITGPTGTGKELFANTIHENSDRKKGRFVVVDCAALPEQLVESVLFGHVKGVFTSADSDAEGLVKKAHGGTLFLDEIGELPLNIQKKFLRVLQERRFKPVGGTTEVKSNFRLISATNRDLDKMVANNEFRSDLLYRIKTVNIDLPPLKECREDIRPLTLHYIHSLCEYHGLESMGFSSEFLNHLESYDWPGNVRELISSLEKAILANTNSTVLYPKYLPHNIRLHNIQTSIHGQAKTGSLEQDEDRGADIYALTLPKNLLDPIKPLKQVKRFTVAETEKLYLSHLMKASQKDMEKASDLACISKSRLYSLLKSHQLQ